MPNRTIILTQEPNKETYRVIISDSIFVEGECIENCITATIIQENIPPEIINALMQMLDNFTKPKGDNYAES